MFVEVDFMEFKEDVEIVMKIKFIMLHYWLVYQDVQETSNILTENANVSKDITSLKENVFFVIVGNFLIQNYKNVFQTVEIILITFHQEDSANVKKDFIKF